MKNIAKKYLPLVVLALITIVVECSSPLCLWMQNEFTSAQQNLYDVAMQIRQGYVAYVDVDSNYGPVINEVVGLGFLLTESHIVHFVTELFIIFISLWGLYNAARVYTSEIMSVVAATIVVLTGWGSFCYAGPEEIIFPLFSCLMYHFGIQIANNYRGNHTYLMGVELGLILFAQPGYFIIWAVAFVFLAVYFCANKLPNKQYIRYWASIIEGVVTVAIPMGLYMYFVKNGEGFIEQVLVENLNSLAFSTEGLKTVVLTPWIVLFVFFIVAGLFLLPKKKCVWQYFGWLILSVAVLIVVSIQCFGHDTVGELAKVIYVVPLALLGVFFDKLFGRKKEVSEKLLKKDVKNNVEEDEIILE